MQSNFWKIISFEQVQEKNVPLHKAILLFLLSSFDRKWKRHWRVGWTAAASVRLRWLQHVWGERPVITYSRKTTNTDLITWRSRILIHNAEIVSKFNKYFLFPFRVNLILNQFVIFWHIKPFKNVICFIDRYLVWRPQYERQADNTERTEFISYPQHIC